MPDPDIVKLTASLDRLNNSFKRFMEDANDKNGSGSGAERLGRGGRLSNNSTKDAVDGLDKLAESVENTDGPFRALATNLKRSFHFSHISKATDELADAIKEQTAYKKKEYIAGANAAMKIAKESKGVAQTLGKMNDTARTYQKYQEVYAKIQKAFASDEAKAADKTTEAHKAYIKSTEQAVKELKDLGEQLKKHGTSIHEINDIEEDEAEKHLNNITNFNKANKIQQSFTLATMKTNTENLKTSFDGIVGANEGFMKSIIASKTKINENLITATKVVGGAAALDMKKTPGAVESQLQSGLKANWDDWMVRQPQKMGVGPNDLNDMIAQNRVTLRSMGDSTHELDVIQSGAFQESANQLKRFGLKSEQAMLSTVKTAGSMIGAGITRSDQSVKDFTDTIGRSAQIFSMNHAAAEQFVSDMSKESWMLSRLSNVNDERERNALLREEIESRFKVGEALGFSIEQIKEYNKEMFAARFKGGTDKIRETVRTQMGMATLRHQGANISHEDEMVMLRAIQGAGDPNKIKEVEQKLGAFLGNKIQGMTDRAAAANSAAELMPIAMENIIWEVVMGGTGLSAQRLVEQDLSTGAVVRGRGHEGMDPDARVEALFGTMEQIDTRFAATSEKLGPIPQLLLWFSEAVEGATKSLAGGFISALVGVVGTVGSHMAGAYAYDKVRGWMGGGKPPVPPGTPKPGLLDRARAAGGSILNRGRQAVAVGRGNPWATGLALGATFLGASHLINDGPAVPEPRLPFKETYWTNTPITPNVQKSEWQEDHDRRVAEIRKRNDRARFLLQLSGGKPVTESAPKDANGFLIDGPRQYDGIDPKLWYKIDEYDKANAPKSTTPPTSNPTALDVGVGVGSAAMMLPASTTAASTGGIAGSGGWFSRMSKLAGAYALPVTAMISAVGSYNTSTDEYRNRYGLGESSGGWGDLGVRSAGVMADLGNVMTLGIADKIGRSTLLADTIDDPTAFLTTGLLGVTGVTGYMTAAFDSTMSSIGELMRGVNKVKFDEDGNVIPEHELSAVDRATLEIAENTRTIVEQDKDNRLSEDTKHNERMRALSKQTKARAEIDRIAGTIASHF